MGWGDLGWGSNGGSGYGKGFAAEGGDPYGFWDGGGRTESMEPGNTHWALMDWALKSAERTRLGTAAKRIRLDRRAQKMPLADQCNDLQRYRGLDYKVLRSLQM